MPLHLHKCVARFISCALDAQHSNPESFFFAAVVLRTSGLESDMLFCSKVAFSLVFSSEN